jgi:hypothetical protein
MKKLNAILILVTALSIATLVFVLYSTGVFAKGEPEPTPVPGATPSPVIPREQYQNDYEADPDQSKEIAVINVLEHFTTYGSPDTIYTYSFQNKVRASIDKLIEEGDYTEDEPLVIRNPFCTNTQSLYIYFRTSYPCAAGYNVHVSSADSGADDFGGYVIASKEHYVFEDGCEEEVNTSLVHEFSITGIQPGITNTITIRLVDEKGIIRMRRFYYNFEEGLDNSTQAKLKTERATKTVVVDEETLETATVNVSPHELSDGLFAVFRGINGYVPYMMVYDNKGYARMEVPLVDTTAESVCVKDGFMYLPVSQNKFVKISSLGEVVKIYTTDEFRFESAWCMDDNGNALIVATDLMQSGKRDVVCVVDLEKDAVSKLFDMGDLLKDYKAASGKKDWIGLSSISYTGDNMVVLSADVPGVLIKVRRIYNGPRLVGLAGTGKGFEELENISKFFFVNEGNFDFPSTVTMSGYREYDLIKETRSYIWMLDRNKDYRYEKNEEHFSYFTELLIDDEERTVRKIKDSVLLPELFDDSKLMKHGDNWLLINGADSSFKEYDEDLLLINTFTYEAPKTIKTIEQQDKDEDDPPPDDTVRYTGIDKFDPLDYLFTDEVIVYVNTEKN